MSADFSYVQRHYGVPAEIGRMVVVSGKPGVITEARGHYIGVTFDDDILCNVHNVHPLDATYGDKLASPPKLTRSQQRYRNYLRADTGEPFGEYLRRKRP